MPKAHSCHVDEALLSLQEEYGGEEQEIRVEKVGWGQLRHVILYNKTWSR